MEAPPFPLSSRPKRTRISYFALLATTTYAVFLKKTAYVLINATNLDRKSGGAEWRDLRFSGHFLEVFFDRAKRRRRTCGFISWVPTHPLKPRWQSVDRFTTFSGRLNPEAAILSGLHSDACAIADVTEAVSHALCLSRSLHGRAAESGASTPLPRMSTKIWGIRFGFPHFKKRIAG